jgi:sialidase-1
VSKVLEEGPASYADFAVLADGTVLCLYESGMMEHMFIARHVTLARFDIDWLTTP